MWTMIWSIDFDEVCVKDLKLVKYHNKEAKVNWIKILGLYLWTFEWAN
jgi:hypothetical protein